MDRFILNEAYIRNPDLVRKNLTYYAKRYGNERIHTILDSWVQKKVFKWIVNNPDTAGLARFINGEYELRKYNGFNVGFINVLQHVIDWINSLDERGLRKLDRVTFKQAIQKADEWTQEVNKRNEDKEDWDNVKVVMEWPDGFKVVHIKGDVCLSREGKLMGHCVGGGGYKNADIYSLRDKKNNPHVTLEVRYDEVYQIKGRGNNRPIEKYHPYLRQFIQKYKLIVVEDGESIGLIKYDDTYYDPDSEEWEHVYNTKIIPYQQRRIKDIMSRVKDGVINGSVNLGHIFLKELPDLSDVIVTKDFYFDINQVESLKGCPKAVGGTFSCSGNKLQTLEGAPEKVDGAFNCNRNQLKSLEGAPREIGKSFFCNYNQLEYLVGAPRKVGGGFDCSGNPLQTLEGAPEKIDGWFHSDRFTDKDYREYQQSRVTTFKKYYNDTE